MAHVGIPKRFSASYCGNRLHSSTPIMPPSSLSLRSCDHGEAILSGSSDLVAACLYATWLNPKSIGSGWKRIQRLPTCSDLDSLNLIHINPYHTYLSLFITILLKVFLRYQEIT